MKNSEISKWLKACAGLVVAVMTGVLVLLLLGRLPGPTRNLVPQIWVAGVGILFLLGGYVWRFHPEVIPRAPAKFGLLLLVGLAAALVAGYFYSIHSTLGLRYDLASWSEPMMIADIIKLRTGEHLYLKPEDSNSNVYSPGAPTVTYFLAWLLGRPTSIPCYRRLQQFYLVLAAIFAAAAARDLLMLAAPERYPRVPRAWLVFFVLTAFLLVTNPKTATFNVYLHNDPLATLVSASTFWLLMRYCLTQDSRWLWALAVAPALGFMVRQPLAAWAGACTVCVWLGGNLPFRRVLAFGLICFGLLAAALAICLLVWGGAFRYWTYEPMGTQVVSPIRMADRYADAAGCILLGLLGGWVLLRGRNPKPMFGLWISWVILLLSGLYSSGIAYHSTHLGPATIVAGCFSLVALAVVWPNPDSATQPPASQWLQMGICLLLVLTVFADLGVMHRPTWLISADLSRYVKQIEKEFDSLPPDRVLLDLGDWIYLRHDVVMKDRQPMLTTHQTPHYGLLERVRRQEYARILVHELANGDYAYDLGGNRGIRDAILAHYHEVRRIPRVRGMENWLYTGLTMADVVVLEPITGSETTLRPRTGLGDNVK